MKTTTPPLASSLNVERSTLNVQRSDPLRFALPALAIVIALILGVAIGEHYGAAEDAAWARSLMQAASTADGPNGAAIVRHAVIGAITDITIRPDHVAIKSVWGSRQWFFAPGYFAPRTSHF